jgi:hypothetical protein
MSNTAEARKLEVEDAPPETPVEEPKKPKNQVFSLTHELKGARGKNLEILVNEDEMRLDPTVKPKFEATDVREAVMLSLTQGPDMLTRKNLPPLGDDDKLKAHMLAIAVGNEERTGFPFTTKDKELIRKLSHARLTTEMHCSLTLFLDPNAAESRE